MDRLKRNICAVGFGAIMDCLNMTVRYLMEENSDFDTKDAVEDCLNTIKGWGATDEIIPSEILDDVIAFGLKSIIYGKDENKMNALALEMRQSISRKVQEAKKRGWWK